MSYISGGINIIIILMLLVPHIKNTYTVYYDINSKKKSIKNWMFIQGY